MTRDEIRAMASETIRAGGCRDCLIRLLLSRGPGGFTVNPYECPDTQIYLVVSDLHMPSPEKYERGVLLKSSGIAPKKPFFATIKSCNYLQNVLMKKEAVDADVDYTVALDEQGFLTEGSAENMAIVTQDKVLKLPRFTGILKGTTVSRAIEMAGDPLASSEIGSVVFGDITLEEAYGSEEILIFGTSFNVLPAVHFDGRPVGTGKPGKVFQYLRERFLWDTSNNSDMLTPVF
jgi:branched-chain amino acid aminotransferase